MSPAALRSVVWTVRTTPSRSTVTANAGTGPTGPVVSSPPTIRTAAATVATTRRTRSSELTLGKERPARRRVRGVGRRHVPVGELGDREQRVGVGHRQPGGGIVRLGARRRRRDRRFDRGGGFADDGLGVGRAGRARRRRAERAARRAAGGESTSSGSGNHAAASCGSARGRRRRDERVEREVFERGKVGGIGNREPRVGVVRHRARGRLPNRMRDVTRQPGMAGVRARGAGSRRVARIALCVIGDRVRLAGSVSGTRRTVPNRTRGDTSPAAFGQVSWRVRETARR